MTRPLEALEPRRLMAFTTPVISEFLANNSGGVRDEDGTQSDWIELHNPTAGAVNLDGYYLTDDAANKRKWRLPAVTLPARGYLVVWASEKNRRTVGRQLHTNFKMDADGEYLAFVKPDGVTVLSQFSAAFPKQTADVSYGIPVTQTNTALVGPRKAAKVRVPTDGSLGLTWKERTFSDTSWQSGVTGIGYEPSPPTPPDYTPLIGTNVGALMFNRATSAYVRVPFTADVSTPFNVVNLKMKYDDGFVAYVNGVEVARRNTPAGTPQWNWAAPTVRDDASATVYENIAIPASLLRTGTNVLAIHGINVSPTSSDVLIYPEVQGTRVTLGSAYRYLKTPTPGAPNISASGTGVIFDTKFSKDRGFYSSPFTVAITTATSGATIRYTTNGSPPTETTGTVYTGPITINKTTTLRAAAFRSGYLPSNVDTQTYVFVDDVIRQSPTGAPPAGWPSSWGQNVVDYGMDPDVVNSSTYSGQIRNALKAVPTISLTMKLSDLFDPTTGIYANARSDGRDWERPASVELIRPDGTTGFQIDAGVRIRGGYSRSANNPKHAFRLFFRDEYGDGKLNYAMFGAGGAKSYDSFDLRTFQNYSWSFDGSDKGIFLRDQFSRDTQLAMGHQAERGDYYHLYINGQYWGLYNSAERPDADYAASYFGGDEDDYDVVKVDPDLGYAVEATDGNLDAWNELWARASAGLASEAAYQRVLGNNADGTRNTSYRVLVEQTNLIDYMLLTYYTGNFDAPISGFLGNNSPNNFFAIRNRGSNSAGFRFFSHDAEHSLFNVNEDRTGPYPAGSQGPSKSNPQYLFQQMMANPTFRLKVADRVQKHFFNNGALTPTAVRDRLLKRKTEIDVAVIAESARWGDSKRPSQPFTRNVEWIGEINRILTQYVPQRTAVVLNQLRADGLYPSVAAPVLSRNGGSVPAGFQLTISNPGGAGSIYYTLDGKDPRLLSGGVSSSAVRYTGAITLSASRTVKARVLNGTTWSAMSEANFTVAATTGSISGTVFNDLDGDGTRDANEPPLANFQTYLDLNANGVPDSGEPRAFTDGSGNYRFSNLAAGTFRVRCIFPSGWRRVSPSSGYHSVTLASGGAATGRLFAFTQKVLVSGAVFNDVNGDRVRNSGEVGLAGWRVYVDADNDGVFDSTEKSVLSDSAGNWTFKDLPAGTFVVRVVSQAGWTRTTPTTGSYTITLSAAQSSTNRLFGMRR